MSEHSEEPWFTDGSDVNAKICGITTMIADCLNHKSIRRSNAEATAKRIVACVNACAGIHQDVLDGGWTAKGLSEYAKSLEHQRNELLLAIKPFANLVRTTNGRMPTERLSLSDWHNLSKAAGEQS